MLKTMAATKIFQTPLAWKPVAGDKTGAQSNQRMDYSEEATHSPVPLPALN